MGIIKRNLLLAVTFNQKNRKNLGVVGQGRHLPNSKEFLSIFVTFGLTVFAWIFFRANSIGHAFDIIAEIFSSSIFTTPQFEGINMAITTLILIVIFILVEWFGREEQYAIARVGIVNNTFIRHTIYYVIVFLIVYLGNFNENQFIYFQF